MQGPNAIRARLAGCIAPVVTPLDEAGRLAIGNFGAVFDFFAAQGVSGIVPGDLIGEHPALSVIERQALIKGAVEQGRGRFMIIALVSDPHLETAIGLARFAENAGADAIKIALPYPYVPSDAAILEYVRAVTGATTLPYLIESSDGLQVSIPVIETLSVDPRFAGMEEMGTDVFRLQRLHRDFCDRLALLPAGDTALFVLGLLGAPGCFAAENNFAPAFMRQLLDACRRRDLDRALDLFGRRARYRENFREGLARASFTPWTKAAMRMLGLPVGPTRLPHEPLTEAEQAALRRALVEEFGLDPVG